jgi:hypothetical protein
MDLCHSIRSAYGYGPYTIPAAVKCADTARPRRRNRTEPGSAHAALRWAVCEDVGPKRAAMTLIGLCRFLVCSGERLSVGGVMRRTPSMRPLISQHAVAL